MLHFALLAPVFAGVAHAAAASEKLVIGDILLDPSLLLPGLSNPVSCHNTTVQKDTCCFNAPGGHFLQTQFWDYVSPAQFAGPSESWTVHGLWPDNCDGTWEQFCAPERESTNITQILEFNKEYDILKYMQKYWKDNKGNDESFWEHEWNKHGTCISTLEPQCIRSYNQQKRNDIIIYLKRTLSLYMTLPTFDFLKKKGITPSATKTYKFADVMSAITKGTGKTPTIQCDGKNKNFLHEMWYHYETKGSVIDGVWLHANADSESNCADEVYYWPKGVPTPTPTATSTSSAPTPTSTEDKGTIQVYTAEGNNVGCVLSKGTWAQLTCATFRPTLGSAPGTIKFTSSKGPCAVDATNTLTCATGVAASDFSNSTISTGSLLAFNGNTAFSSDAVPTGQVQGPIFADSTHPQAITLVYTRS
ncbi:ribonuclease M [Cristinia sonorae]|uniref:Ribonuclease T2-like n=1 Tax=Cristinia sonorae TaxID=1940300 RepID=A0A8K0XWE7_9AGAR|nr:ribonuclease M [Cristinia sonorae]